MYNHKSQSIFVTTGSSWKYDNKYDLKSSVPTDLYLKLSMYDLKNTSNLAVEQYNFKIKNVHD